MRAMTVRVEVRPQLLEWARARSGIDAETWAGRFQRYDDWLTGRHVPTLKQLKEFARKTYTPIGFLFLDEPPLEEVPIPDFRTTGNRPKPEAVSGDLLDTLYACQSRQEWYRDNQLMNGEEPLAFVGTATTATAPSEAAGVMRDLLDWGSEARERLRGPDAALTRLRENAESIGVLVMISGIVGSNTHRKLDPEEFRGFALSDPYAPLVFVNGADSKAAQVFTLAHELAHLWLGSTALSDAEATSARQFEDERWCNQVAAELLVPLDEFMSVFDAGAGVRPQLRSLAERFSVSTQVILGRMREAGALTWDQYLRELDAERRRIAEVVPKSGSGGDYYNTKAVQVSKRFASEVIASTLEGQTSYTEAFYLLGVKNSATFFALRRHLGVR